jgi:hypothetical protein
MSAFAQSHMMSAAVVAVALLLTTGRAFSPSRGISQRRASKFRTVVHSAPAVITEDQFMGMISNAVVKKYGEAETKRVLDAFVRLGADVEHEGRVEFVSDTPPHEDGTALMVQKCRSRIEGLTLQPFHEPMDHKWCRTLAKEWTVVRDELTEKLSAQGANALENVGNNIWVGAKNSTSAAEYGDKWKTLGLCDRGVWDADNTAIFPRTCELLHRAGAPVIEALFAKMPAKSTIGVHSDMVNFCLTFHLGVDVPEGECWIDVGDQRRHWENGGLLLFDTSILHRAENTADRTRYIFMMRVWHPDLSDAERNAMQFVFDCLDEPEILTSGASLDDYDALRAQVEKESQDLWRNALPSTTKTRKKRKPAGFGAKR